jgi:hypothetical protein
MPEITRFRESVNKPLVVNEDDRSQSQNAGPSGVDENAATLKKLMRNASLRSRSNGTVDNRTAPTIRTNVSYNSTVTSTAGLSNTRVEVPLSPSLSSSMVVDPQGKASEGDLQAALKYFQVDVKGGEKSVPRPPSPPPEVFLDRSLRPSPLDISAMEGEIDIVSTSFGENPDEIYASSILFEPGSDEHSPDMDSDPSGLTPPSDSDEVLPLVLASPEATPLPSITSPAAAATPSDAGERRVSVEDFVAEAKAERARLHGTNNIKSTTIQVGGE